MKASTSLSYSYYCEIPSNLLPLYKSNRLLPLHNPNTTRLPPETHTIALLRDQQHLGPERRADELPVVGLLLEHQGDGGAVLRVEVGVDLVEEVEGGGVAGLDGEYEGEGA